MTRQRQSDCEMCWNHDNDVRTHEHVWWDCCQKVLRTSLCVGSRGLNDLWLSAFPWTPAIRSGFIFGHDLIAMLWNLIISLRIQKFHQAAWSSRFHRFLQHATKHINQNSQDSHTDYSVCVFVYNHFIMNHESLRHQNVNKTEELFNFWAGQTTQKDHSSIESDSKVCWSHFQMFQVPLPLSSAFDWVRDVL